MTGPSGSSEVCFLSTLNGPFGFASGNIESLGETNLAVSREASHKVLSEHPFKITGYHSNRTC